jgi:hypothetical protein
LSSGYHFTQLIEKWNVFVIHEPKRILLVIS